jgi:membrane-associated phospholipid phosphatase
MNPSNAQVAALTYWLIGVLILITGGLVICYSPDCRASNFDLRVLGWLGDQRSETADWFFRWATWFGSVAVLFPTVLLAAALLVRRKRLRDAAFLLLAFVGILGIIYTSKFASARPRPIEIEPLIAMPLDPSFPSAHVAQVTALIFAGLILTRRIVTRWSNYFLVAGLIGILMVAVSRLYLQVHYLSDVLVGTAVAMLWVLGLSRLMLRQT